MRAFDVQGADDGAVDGERDGERASRTGGALDVTWIVGGVGTDVGLAGCGDEAGDSVTFGASVKLAVGGQGCHSLGQERDQAVGGAIEESDLDEVETEQVSHVAGDVVLEEVGALFDGHLGELGRGEVG